MSAFSRDAHGFRYAFAAMASPCEVLVDGEDEHEALSLGQAVEAEAARIEAKYSRYRPDNIIARINAADDWVELDEETSALVACADQFFRLSEGRFDITSGVLRRIWRFDGSDRIPSDPAIAEVAALVGWSKVEWAPPRLRLRPGMEIDLGGLAKEYAVDCATLKCADLARSPYLVNFGGDLRVSGPRRQGRPWTVAIESVDKAAASEAVIELAQGALATSGDARRYLLKDGVRYGHILDPRCGRPVADPPRSVTVHAGACLEAGFLTTLAMLHGAEAEAFLEAEGLRAWWIR